MTVMVEGRREDSVTGARRLGSGRFDGLITRKSLSRVSNSIADTCSPR